MRRPPNALQSGPFRVISIIIDNIQADKMPCFEYTLMMINEFCVRIIKEFLQVEFWVMSTIILRFANRMQYQARS